jgi:archaellum biogenesis ATPase FlaH
MPEKNESAVNILQEFKEHDVIVLVLNDNYNEKMARIVQQLGKKKCCYVSLNKPYKQLVASFNKQKIALDNILIVDAISGTVGATSSAKNCINVSSPNALTELNITITGICGHTPELLLFDSLSTLLVYDKGATATKFIHSVINNLRIHKVKGLFTVLKSDADTEFVKSVEMFADKVVEM